MNGKRRTFSSFAFSPWFFCIFGIDSKQSIQFSRGETGTRAEKITTGTRRRPREGPLADKPVIDQREYIIVWIDYLRDKVNLVA